MKIIELSQGFKAAVDDEDYDWLIQWKWCAKVSKKNVHAIRYNKYGSNILMHRAIMERYGKTGLIEHNDRDGTNNQKSNLKESNKSRNALNRDTKGVTKRSDSSNYKAQLRVSGNYVLNKTFKTYEEAKAAYEEAKTYFLK